MKGAPNSRRHFLNRSAAGLFAACGLGQQTIAQAQTAIPNEIATELPAAVYSGAARLRFFGFDVYDSKLWVVSGFKAANYAQHPFALELSYLRSLSGTAIAERSIKEMRRVGSISSEQESRWLKAMQEAFPDVKAGDRIVGLHTPGAGARFWYNGQSRPSVADVEFSRYFFGIWLHENTSEPKLRTSLLERTAQ
jgi:hypothetical protein